MLAASGVGAAITSGQPVARTSLGRRAELRFSWTVPSGMAILPDTSPAVLVSIGTERLSKMSKEIGASIGSFAKTDGMF
jgi:hypothetical protein